LNKLIKCNVRSLRCSTTPIVEIRYQKVNNHPVMAVCTLHTHKQHILTSLILQPNLPFSFFSFSVYVTLVGCSDGVLRLSVFVTLLCISPYSDHLFQVHPLCSSRSTKWKLNVIFYYPTASSFASS